MSAAALRRIAWLALFGVTTGLVVPVLDGDHAGRVDPDSSFGISAHQLEHPVAHLAPAAASPAADHCAICHWSRLLGHSSVGRRFVAPVSPVHAGPPALDVALPTRPATGGSGIRGPPPAL